MSVARSRPEGPLATVTHARLRESQGDRRAAVRILREVLARDPDHREARGLLDRLSRSTPAPRRDREATARIVGALERWLERVRSNAGDVRAG